MNNEFRKQTIGNITRYVLESASGGGTSAGSVASVSTALGGVQHRPKDSIFAQEEKKKEAPKPRNFVAKNAKMGGAGKMKDKSKTIPRHEKHKKPVAEGEVVPLGKKHRGDLEDTHSCPKCDGDLQSGTYMGRRVKVCQPCKQVYLPPNSGIDQSGNEVSEGERTMSRAAKGVMKYGKDGMKALAKAGREGASEKKLDAIRDKHDHYNESIVSSGDATLELLELNIFKDLIGEHSLSNYDEEFARSPEWQRVVAKWAPKAEGLYNAVIRLHNAGKKINSQEARSITDTAYDGSDAYNDPESAASDLPRIYAQQYRAISQFIENLPNRKPNTIHEQGLAEAVWDRHSQSHIPRDGRTFGQTNHPREEHCDSCGAPTGHAGPGEDSNVDDNGNVYCDDCYADEQGVAEGEYNPDTFVGKKGTYKGYGITQEGPYQWGISSSLRKFSTLAGAKRHIDKVLVVSEQGVAEEWSKKYKSSINCSHPKGFSQKAHCAGKKKHNESMMTMEAVCPDCGMCQTHGNISEIKKGAKDSNGFTKCWPGHHAAGTKKGKNGGQVRNCVPNEGVAEDHEIQMASSELQSAYINAKKLFDIVKQRSEEEGLDAWQQSKITKAADYLNSVLTAIRGEQTEDYGMNGYATYAGTNHGRGVAEDAYMESLAQQLAEKIPKNAPVKTYIDDFAKAAKTPNAKGHHQFKNKSPEKVRQMAIAASYGAKNPSKKK